MRTFIAVDGYVRTERTVGLRVLRRLTIDLDQVEDLSQRADGRVVIHRRGRLGDVLVLEGGEAVVAALARRGRPAAVEEHPPGVAPLRWDDPDPARARVPAEASRPVPVTVPLAPPVRPLGPSLG